jgi:UDPglucose 6-dehydrogenase
MIGIIGYGMVGKAVEHGFSKTTCIISDPQYNNLTVEDVCRANPDVIFVCVPTPTDGTNYITLINVLDIIKDMNYGGITVVKSTVLPQYIKKYDVLYNPEFLSRATSFDDFVNPPFVLIGGDMDKASALADIYRTQSTVNMDCVKFTDIKTASLAKYAMNSFYATKVTFMNAMYDVANEVGASYDDMVEIFKMQPWMGTHHFQVPGPDGERGFGGPCLPKDTQALVNEYNVELLKSVLQLNDKYRANK